VQRACQQTLVVPVGARRVEDRHTRLQRGVDRCERLGLVRRQAHAAEADTELRGIEPPPHPSKDDAPDQPAGVTAKIQLRQDVDDVVPPLRSYWFASQTLPTLPVAAGSGVAPE